MANSMSNPNKGNNATSSLASTMIAAILHLPMIRYPMTAAWLALSGFLSTTQESISLRDFGKPLFQHHAGCGVSPSPNLQMRFRR